jgi:hypothetical protein
MDINNTSATNYSLNQPASQIAKPRKTSPKKRVETVDADGASDSFTVSKKPKQAPQKKQSNWVMPLLAVVGGTAVVAAIVVAAHEPTREAIVEHLPEWAKGEKKPPEIKTEPEVPNSGAGGSTGGAGGSTGGAGGSTGGAGGSTGGAGGSTGGAGGSTGGAGGTTKIGNNPITKVNKTVTAVTHRSTALTDPRHDYHTSYKASTTLGEYEITKKIGGNPVTVTQKVPPILHPNIERYFGAEEYWHSNEIYITNMFNHIQDNLNKSQMPVDQAFAELFGILDAHHEFYLGTVHRDFETAPERVQDFKEAFRLAKAHLFLHRLIPHSRELSESSIGNGHLEAARESINKVYQLFNVETENESDTVRNELRDKIDSLKHCIEDAEKRNSFLPRLSRTLKKLVKQEEEMPELNIPNL